jgi:GT2 family glycosyltransferase
MSGGVTGMLRTLLRPYTPKGRLVAKVKARKAARAAMPYVYNPEPKVSLIIQSFNHCANIPRIVERLRLTAAEELIVCEDGSVDGSERVWREQLDRPNDFVILSNDLHEIRTYNRAIALAGGEIVGVMQDDDIPPLKASWVAEAVTLFENHPDMAMLGCWNGWAYNYDSGEKDFDQIVLSHVGGGLNFDQPVNPVPHRDPRSGLPFAFVESVGIGPMFFRKKDFLALGGFDLALSGPGEPGIWLDYDLCIKAWIAGKQVGVYESDPFERNVGGQGTTMFTGTKRWDNFDMNRKRMQRLHADHIGSIRGKIDALNATLPAR